MAKMAFDGYGSGWCLTMAMNNGEDGGSDR